MSDLISRSALKEEIESLRVMVTGLRSGKGVLAEYAKHYKESVLKLIDEAPTVEAKPSVTGEWLEYPSALYRKCSACKMEFEKQKVQSSNFCQNCGADMRKKVE